MNIGNFLNGNNDMICYSQNYYSDFKTPFTQGQYIIGPFRFKTTNGLTDNTGFQYLQDRSPYNETTLV